MKETLNQIIQDLIDIRKEKKLTFDDKDLMDFSVRILNSGRLTHFSDSKEIKKPTEKQINFLKKNDYNGDLESLTFEEAKVLISEFIESQKGREI